MKSLPTRLSGLALAALLLATGASTAMAGQEAAVVTVGSNAKGEADSTLWAIAVRYMPEETRNKKPNERTDKENAEITAKYKALKDYHNALANTSGKGRIITDPNRLKVGEQLYLPSQSTIEDLAKLQSADGNIPPAKFDQMMRTVLSDVAENQDVIKRSKSSSALTTQVLATAARVGETDDRAEQELGDGGAPASRSLIEEAMPDTELDDESAPTDAVVLDTDGAPTAVSPAGPAASSSSTPNNIVDLTEKTSILENLLGTIEQGANDPSNPNREKLKALARQIKDELARRKREEEKEAERQAAAAPSTPSTTGTSAPQTASAPATGPATAGTQLADAENQETGPIEIEYVPDWYLRALQEWNLQNYWQSKANKAKDAAKGRKTILDPLTGKERKVDEGDDPFSEFSDELTNYTRNQGQVEKREGP